MVTENKNNDEGEGEMSTSLRDIENAMTRIWSEPEKLKALQEGVTDRGARNLNVKASPTILALYQDPETHEVRVQKLGETVAAVVLVAGARKTSYADLAKLALAKVPDPNNEEIRSLVFETFENLQDLSISQAQQESRGHVLPLVLKSLVSQNESRC